SPCPRDRGNIRPRQPDQPASAIAQRGAALRRTQRPSSMGRCGGLKLSCCCAAGVSKMDPEALDTWTEHTITKKYPPPPPLAQRSELLVKGVETGQCSPRRTRDGAASRWVYSSSRTPVTGLKNELRRRLLRARNAS